MSIALNGGKEKNVGAARKYPPNLFNKHRKLNNSEQQKKKVETRALIEGWN